MRRAFTAFLAALTLSAAPCPAQPAPVLASVPPIYLRQGETRDVPLTGQNLEKAFLVLMVDPWGQLAAWAPDLTKKNIGFVTAAQGLSASLLPAGKPGGPRTLRLVAAADAALGEHELRVDGVYGVTRPLTVTVGTLPSVDEVEPNDSPDKAQKVALPACLLGLVDRPGDVDCYRFAATKGQHLLFDVNAVRVGSALQAVVTIHDLKGRELPATRTDHAGDAMAAFDPPADGDYVLQVRDLRYRGGGDYAYRIDAGEIPYVEALVPSSAPAGRKVSVKAIGHNLGGGADATLDLTGDKPSRIAVQIPTPRGPSNFVPFIVTDPADTPAAAPAAPSTQPARVAIPSEQTGILATAGGENAYRFTIAKRQPLSIAVAARASGSPVDALLTLKTVAGQVIEQSNGTGEFEAKISRPLEAGDYVATVRDLTFGGGPNYVYRLAFGDERAEPEYTFRFMPDAVRLPRGGSAKLWCEIVRSPGMTGPVGLGIKDLPAGVKLEPASLDVPTSGIVTLTAAADAPLGTFPLTPQLTTSAKLKPNHGAELDGRIVRQAYLTIMPPAPIAFEPLGAAKPEKAVEYARQIAELRAKIDAPNPKVEAGQAAWEKQFEKAAPATGPWTPLALSKLQSAGGATLSMQPDGSFAASGADPERDTFTLTAATDLKQIAAVRIEALGDPQLPANGPGRSPNGNFVLSRLTVTAAPKADPSKAQPLAFTAAAASFEQANYPAASAVGAAAGGGWAVVPQTGKSQVAVFRLSTPVSFDSGAVLQFTLDQQYGGRHVMGRVRVSAASDANAPVELGGTGVPTKLLAIIRTPGAERSAEQRAELAAYYRSVSPELAADRARLAGLEALVNPPKLSAARNKQLVIPFAIARQPGFAGDVQVTLEGFAAGRDPLTRLPATTAKFFVITPLTLKGSDSAGKLNIKVNGNSEAGTRMAVLRAETKVGNDAWVQYSPAFPLTVTEK